MKDSLATAQIIHKGTVLVTVNTENFMPEIGYHLKIQGETYLVQEIELRYDERVNVKYVAEVLIYVKLE